MCGGGGGGGGDGGAQARADAEKQRVAQATQQVNSIFGLTDKSLYPDTTTQVPYQVQVPGISDGLVDPNLPTTTETRYNTVTIPNPLLDVATKNKASIDATNASTRQNILDYFTNQLNEQRDVTNRNVSQQLAQAGLTGGSAQTDVNADLSKTYNDALLGFTNQADTSVNNLKSQDEQTRLNLISQITSGADQASAISAANAALSNNAALASSSATQGGIGNIFGNFGQLYNTNQAALGTNAAYNRVASALGLNPGTYSGSVVR